MLKHSHLHFNWLTITNTEIFWNKLVLSVSHGVFIILCGISSYENLYFCNAVIWETSKKILTPVVVIVCHCFACQGVISVSCNCVFENNWTMCPL